jgi:hypothetical protein
MKANESFTVHNRYVANFVLVRSRGLGGTIYKDKAIFDNLLYIEVSTIISYKRHYLCKIWSLKHG